MNLYLIFAFFFGLFFERFLWFGILRSFIFSAGIFTSAVAFVSFRGSVSTGIVITACISFFAAFFLTVFLRSFLFGRFLLSRRFFLCAFLSGRFFLWTLLSWRFLVTFLCLFFSFWLFTFFPFFGLLWICLWSVSF